MYAVPMLIISYPFMVFGMSLFGLSIIGGFLVMLQQCLMYPLTGKAEDLKDSIEMMTAPFVIPVIFWYEIAMYGKTEVKI